MKKLRGIIILLIIINLGVLIYLLFAPRVKSYDYQSYAIEQEDLNKKDSTKQEKQIIKLENESILLSNYEGELATGMVNLKLTDLINGGFEKLYNDTKGINSKNLKNYLETNKEELANKIGITGIVELYDLIEKLQIYKDSIIFEKAEIVENSYSKGNEYDNFIVRISYDNGKTLDIVVLLSNKDFMDKPIIKIK